MNYIQLQKWLDAREAFMVTKAPRMFPLKQLIIQVLDEAGGKDLSCEEIRSRVSDLGGIEIDRDFTGTVGRVLADMSKRAQHAERGFAPGYYHTY